MPYRQNNYSFVIDSSFRPYTQEEMLRPLLMYKDAYEKAEENFNALGEAGKYDYLAGIDPEDEAAKIYNNYANAYNSAFEDFKNYGVRGSRRSLLDLKRRYKSDIGRLDAADKALQEELKIRREKNDPSMLYAENNLKLSSFLDNKRPNLYSISAEDLRKEGMIYGQASSSRIYSNSRIENINKYFQDIVREQGIRPEILNAWRAQLISIPEFDRAVNDILKARRVDENLTGADYETARQSVINGIMEGSIYKEERKTEQNPGALTAAQAINAAHQDQSLRLQGLQSGYRLENGQWIYDPEILKQKREALEANGNINWDQWEQSPDGKWHRKPKDSRESSGTGAGQSKLKLRAAQTYDSDGNAFGLDDDKYKGQEYSYQEVLKTGNAKLIAIVMKHLNGQNPLNHHIYIDFRNGKPGDLSKGFNVTIEPDVNINYPIYNDNSNVPGVSSAPSNSDSDDNHSQV